MEELIAKLAAAGSVAEIVLALGCFGLYKMHRDERKLEREARERDAQHHAEATDRQTEAVERLTDALTALRLESAKSRSSV